MGRAMNAERIFIVGPASWELFTSAFRTALHGYGLSPTIVVCGFDREVRLWSGEDEDFESDPPSAARNCSRVCTASVVMPSVIMP